jgi:hypothetical protein
MHAQDEHRGSDWTGPREDDPWSNNRASQPIRRRCTASPARRPELRVLVIISFTVCSVLCALLCTYLLIEVGAVPHMVPRETGPIASTEAVPAPLQLMQGVADAS